MDSDRPEEIQAQRGLQTRETLVAESGVLEQIERRNPIREGRGMHFAWAGGFEPGEGHYYRIQTPDFLFEYDNTQNGANHIHAVWRQFEGDFGADLLRRHYETSPHHAR